jgi:excisionase family DNA binding protein
VARELAGLLRPDGSVVVPADLAAVVMEILVLKLAGEVRATGGSLTPSARELLVALVEASQRPEVPADLVVANPQVAGVSVAEAAARMGCSRQYVRRLLAAGRLAGRRSGGVWLVHLDRPHVTVAMSQRIGCDAPDLRA